MKKILVASIVAFIVLAGWRVGSVHNNNSSQKASPSNSSRQSNSFNKGQYSVDAPGSIWWIVNKKRPLPDNYTPKELVVPSVSLRLAKNSEQMQIDKQVAPYVEKLFTAANTAGHPLVFASGYRSAAYQKQLYDSYVANDGQASADKFSARPGTSEHQTGFAFDVCPAVVTCDLVQSFGSTQDGIWLANHAQEFGFIIRYIKGKESVTGYEYEPWHLRYVGTDLAQRLHATGQTMEEFFGIK